MTAGAEAIDESRARDTRGGVCDAPLLCFKCEAAALWTTLCTVPDIAAAVPLIMNDHRASLLGGTLLYFSICWSFGGGNCRRLSVIAAGSEQSREARLCVVGWVTGVSLAR